MYECLLWLNRDENLLPRQVRRKFMGQTRKNMFTSSMRPGLFCALPELSLLLFIFWQACLSSHPCLHLSCPLLAMKSGRSCVLLMSTEFLHTPRGERQTQTSTTTTKKATTHTKQKNKTCVLSAELLAMYTNKQLLKSSATCFSSFVGLFCSSRVPANASLLKERHV